MEAIISKLIFLSLSMLMLAGCLASSKEMTATPNSIVFEYNRNFTSHDDAIGKAKAHCARFGKTASLSNTTISPSGNWYTRTFRCE